MKGTGETRDGFGWEYYVGRYDGLGRRRRRWLRTLRRIGGSGTHNNNMAAKLDTARSSTDRKGGRSAPSKATKSIQQKTSSQHHSSLLHDLREQYNFKGFGWTFYKSLLTKRGVGFAFRVPLSSNFDFYDRHLAWPFISTSTYFGYPWVMATFLNAR